MRGTVTETIDRVGMTGLSAKIDLKEKIAQHAKTEVDENNAAEIIAKHVETKVDGKTVHVAMIAEAAVTNTVMVTGIVVNAKTPTSPSAQNVIAVASLKVKVEVVDAMTEAIGKTVHVATIEEVEMIAATSTVMVTGIVVNARIQTSPSVQNVIAVASLKAREEGVSAMTEAIGKTVHVATIEEVKIVVATSMVITTGIVLSARIPTSPSEQNVIVAANQRAKEEVENAAIIAGIIPVAVTLVVATPVVVIAVAEIIELNTVTMIGIAQSVKTRISVSVLNAIAVANPKDKVNRNAVVVVKVTPGVERVTHAVMVDR